MPVGEAQVCLNWEGARPRLSSVLFVSRQQLDPAMQGLPVDGPQEGLNAWWVSRHSDKSALEKCCHPVLNS